MNQKSRAPTAPLPRLTHGPLPAPDLLFLQSVLWEAAALFKCSTNASEFWVNSGGENVGEFKENGKHFSHLAVPFDFICYFSFALVGFYFFSLQIVVFLGSCLCRCLLTFCGRRHPLEVDKIRKQEARGRGGVTLCQMN